MEKQMNGKQFCARLIIECSAIAFVLTLVALGLIRGAW